MSLFAARPAAGPGGRAAAFLRHRTETKRGNRMRALEVSRRTDRAREGASLIEACLVVVMMSLILFGGLQLSRLFAAREVLDYTAMAGARARAVGLNEFMVYKVVRVASIPNAGRMTNPDTAMAAGTAMQWGSDRPGLLWDRAVRASSPYSPMANIERQRIPFYLGGGHPARLRAIMDYEDWRTITHRVDQPTLEMVRVQVQQDVPLRFPLSRAFFRGDAVTLHAGGRDNRGARMAAHSELYLE